MLLLYTLHTPSQPPARAAQPLPCQLLPQVFSAAFFRFFILS
jgi:hypothetical protein